jgi:hypothetical protein
MNVRIGAWIYGWMVFAVCTVAYFGVPMMVTDSRPEWMRDHEPATESQDDLAIYDSLIASADGVGVCQSFLAGQGIKAGQ